MLENPGQKRLSHMTDVKFSGIHELENPEPVATTLRGRPKIPSRNKINPFFMAIMN